MMELKYQTETGCPKVNVSEIGSLIKNNKTSLGFTLVLSGLLLAILGNFASSVVSFVLGGLTTTMAFAYGSLILYYD